MPSRRSLLAATAAAIAARPLVAQEPGWPSRTVRIIAPDAAGSGNDITARLFAPLLEAGLGRPVVIDNRPGAGGRIGVEAAFRSPPDGYTLLLGNAGAMGVNAAIYTDLPYDLETDFVPISLLAIGPNVLVINPRSLPVTDLAGLVAHLRANPGKVNFAITAPGGSAHMMTELFRTATGTDFVLVPYRGAPDMARAVVAGEAPANFNNLINIIPQIRAGEVLPLALTTATQSPLLPGVPTMREAGLDGFESAAWTGLFAPKGTPAPIVARLGAVLAKLREDAALRERLAGLGVELAASDPSVLAERSRADIARWRGLVRQAGLRFN